MQMFSILVVSSVVFLLLCTSEILWRTKAIHPEYARKFVHISVGSFVAFWPFFLDRLSILILSLAFVAVVGATYYWKIFQAVRSVQRPTWGEIFFALAVGLLAIVARNNF